MGGHARAAGGAVHGGWGGIGRGGVVLGEGGRVDGEAGVHHVRDGWVVLERRGTSGAGLGLIRLGESMSIGSRGRGAEDTHQWTRTTADGWDSARGRKRPLSVSSAAPLSTAPWRGLVAAHSTLRRGQAMPFVDAVDRRDSHLEGVDPRNRISITALAHVGGDVKSASRVPVYLVSGGDSNTNIISIVK